VGANGLSLAGPPGSEEISRLSSLDSLAEWNQVRTTWWQEKQDEVVNWSQCNVAANDRSLHARFAVHHKTFRSLG
jgi:hypothetical protein